MLTVLFTTYSVETFCKKTFHEATIFVAVKPRLLFYFFEISDLVMVFLNDLPPQSKTVEQYYQIDPSAAPACQISAAAC